MQNKRDTAYSAESNEDKAKNSIALSESKSPANTTSTGVIHSSLSAPAHQSMENDSNSPEHFPSPKSGLAGCVLAIDSCAVVEDVYPGGRCCVPAQPFLLPVRHVASWSQRVINTVSPYNQDGDMNSKYECNSNCWLDWMCCFGLQLCCLPCNMASCCMCGANKVCGCVNKTDGLTTMRMLRLVGSGTYPEIEYPLQNTHFVSFIQNLIKSGNLPDIIKLTNASEKICRNVLLSLCPDVPTFHARQIPALLVTYDNNDRTVTFEERTNLLKKCWKLGVERQGSYTSGLMHQAIQSNYSEVIEMCRFLWKHEVESLPPRKRAQMKIHFLNTAANNLASAFVDNKLSLSKIRERIKLLNEFGLSPNYFEKTQNNPKVQALNEALHPPLFNFLLGTCNESGKNSTVYTMSQNSIWDRNILREIKEFIHGEKPRISSLNAPAVSASQDEDKENHQHVLPSSLCIRRNSNSG